jgi:hypothetical protein
MNRPSGGTNAYGLYGAQRDGSEDAALAEPVEAFPSLVETLYDIGMVLAIVLGLALTAGAALAG